MPERDGNVGALVEQQAVRGSGEGWHRRVLDDLDNRLRDGSDFPCPFSKKVYAQELLLFIFVDRDDDRGLKKIADGLAAYVDRARRWDRTIGTAHPLVIAFNRDVAQFNEATEYDKFGWRVLRRLHEVDPMPWPEGVGRDPNDAGWSMCFNGMPIFCNMSHPEHLRRRSRNLGEHFIMVVNPRERFDVFAGDNPSGRKLRSCIRNSIERYDGVPHSSLLGSYASGGLEWPQYSLPDNDPVAVGRCPMKVKQPVKQNKI